MNYYEQFYDDLEFCDPEDERHHGRDRYMRADTYSGNDPNYGNDPYSHHDPYYQNDPYHREDPAYYGNYERDSYYQQHDRQGSYSRGRGHEPPRGRGRGREPPDNRNSGRGVHRGRGHTRGGQRGGMKTMNFVKAGTIHPNAPSNQSGKQGNGENKGGGSSSDQIRFDYKSYQNQPSEMEVEEEEALRAYKGNLGFGYGYGPREDLIEGEQPEWLISSEETGPMESQVTGSEAGPVPVETEATEIPEAKPNVKTAMVKPAFNFVKARSEFHSIDVAFHEIEEEKPKANSLSVNYGNRRVGLGFGVSVNKGVPSVDISAKFYAGMRDGCNPQMDAKFKRLQDTVKAKTLPNKNAIEILHMAVDKVKMAMSDEISASGRTPAGQPMFACKLEIDGITVALGQATAKKAAKHEAYQNALKVFNSQSLTVKEISQGIFELREKDVEFKVPGPVGQSAFKAPGQKPTYVPAQKSQTASAGAKTSTVTTSQASSTSYTKPKIVFHQPAHPLNNRPLEFMDNKSGSPETGFQNNNATCNKPEAMAMKLLNFVKEESAQSANQSGTSTSLFSETSSTTQEASFMQNKGRKRPPGQSPKLDGGKLKVQRRGGNVQTSIDDLSQFILIDNSSMNRTATDLSILHNSANFNRVVLKLEHEGAENGYRCSLVLSDIIVAISHGSTKEEAKLKAASDSLNYLRECCYTLKVKQSVDSDDGGLTKEQLLSDIQKAGETGGGGVIPDNNIGNMLLRKMGWAGGGCGKDGKGIAEPVKAEMIIGREGLGLKAEKGIGKNFHQKVTKMLEDYIKSDEQKDLYFSSELSKDERAIIHKIGQKMGLKTHSKGKDVNRFLVVSRKRSAWELLAHVKESGGSTSKYELIPPGDSDLDPFRREDISHGHGKQ